VNVVWPEVRNLADVGYEELCVHSSPLLTLIAIVTLSNDQFQLLVLGPAPVATARERRLVVAWDFSPV